MEVPNRLADILTEGQTLVIRGDGNDSAVLCSGDVTFDLKEAETSNRYRKFPKAVLASSTVRYRDPNVLRALLNPNFL